MPSRSAKPSRRNVAGGVVRERSPSTSTTGAHSKGSTGDSDTESQKDDADEGEDTEKDDSEEDTEKDDSDEDTEKDNSEEDNSGKGGDSSGKGDANDQSAAEKAPAPTPTIASRKKSKKNTFVFVGPEGDVWNFQRRKSSLIQSQEQYSWVMGFYHEFRMNTRHGRGKAWFTKNVLPEYIQRYGMNGLDEVKVQKVLYKLLNNRATTSAVKARALHKSLGVSGRAPSAKEIFNKSIHDELIDKARAERKKQVAEQAKSIEVRTEADFQALSTLNIRNALAKTAWEELDPNEQAVYKAMADVEKEQRQLLREGRRVDPSFVLGNLSNILKGFFEDLQQSLPAWSFHLQACGAKSNGEEKTYTLDFAPAGAPSYKVWMGEDYATFKKKWADYAAILKAARDSAALTKDHVRTTTPPAPAPPAPAPPAHGGKATPALPMLDHQVGTAEIMGMFLKFAERLWDDTFSDAEAVSPLFRWEAIAKDPDAYLTSTSVPPDVKFHEDGPGP
ncbi:hypothetical protein BOTBODRAFT_182538 [Botryobasidium botryosum FD-172 SS1]|uniref:Uncharacterized protein n=1 Tax=Botryobasidium botryosum (strain FD-172 SS1) TaxID=930990 RepID=A0A067LR68_BOTB1|nr:hypothetical protein BOTBODRAFT_182538 [Botryobasidium botryosum FD-172 SS1]